MKRGKRCFVRCVKKQKERINSQRKDAFNFQHSTLMKHASYNDHQLALKDVKLKKQTERCVDKVNINDGTATKASFHTVYCMVKEGMPLGKFSALVKLQIKNGCNDLMNIPHQHPSHISEMVEMISQSDSQSILEKDTKTIKEGLFIGVLIDETSDKKTCHLIQSYC